MIYQPKRLILQHAKFWSGPLLLVRGAGFPFRLGGRGGNISEWGGMAYDQLCVCATYLSGLAKALQIPKNLMSTLEIVLIFLLADFSASVSFFLPALT